VKNDCRANLSVEYQPVCDLKPFARNSRTHSKQQIRQISESIKAFGFNNPVLVDRNNTVIAGAGRVAAANLLGISQVPTIRIENLSGDEQLTSSDGVK
jgi:ParB-like chromosome segregation protein Spo0J